MARTLLSSVLCLLFSVLCLTAAGCSGKYTPVHVSGVVTLDGKAIEGATVYFYVVGDALDGRPAHGITDKNGEFQLSTMGKNDGALPRNYKVVVHKMVPTKPDLKMPNFPNTVEGRAERQDWMYRNYQEKGIHPFKNALPTQYSDPEKTPLTCNVTESTTCKFELTWK